MRTQNSKLKTQKSKLPAYAGLIRWAFARFYREFAWTYDTVAKAVSYGRWFEWGRASLPFLRGQVLELGCGTGHLQLALAERTEYPAVGLDASPHMLAIARRHLKRAGHPIHLARSIAQTLPFADSAFDSLVATFPTEYILDPLTLAELRRVLRSGGRLVVVLAATFGQNGFGWRLIDLLYRLTLQRPPTDPPERIARSLLGQRLILAEFVVEERWHPVGDHHVHLLICERV